MFPKNPKLWTFWELLNPYTSWNAFKEENWFFASLKISMRFFEKKTFFPKERNSGTLAEILSKNIICVGYYIKLAKIKDCEKNSSLSQKKPTCFSTKNEIWNFWQFQSKNSFWDTFSKIFAKNKDFEEIHAVFWKTPSIFTKLSLFRTFWVSSSNNTTRNAS